MAPIGPENWLRSVAWAETNVNVYRIVTVLAGLCLASTASAEAAKGSVCLGLNLAKVSTERSQRLQVRVNDSALFTFTEPYGGPRLAVAGLDLDKSHRVRV